MEEFIHVSFDESNAIPPRKDILNDIEESLEQMRIHGQDSKGKGEGSNEDSHVDETKKNDDLPREWKASRDHPLNSIIGDILKCVTTRHSHKDICDNMAFVSIID